MKSIKARGSASMPSSRSVVDSLAMVLYHLYRDAELGDALRERLRERGLLVDFEAPRDPEDPFAAIHAINRRRRRRDATARRRVA